MATSLEIRGHHLAVGHMFRRAKLVLADVESFVAEEAVRYVDHAVPDCGHPPWGLEAVPG